MNKMFLSASESEVQRGVIRALKRYELCGRLVWQRQNTGAVSYPGKDGKERHVAFGKRGNPDLRGFLAPAGRAFGIEVKRTNWDPGRIRRKDELAHWGEQLARGREYIRMGGLWVWVNSIDQAERFLYLATTNPLLRVEVDPVGYCTLTDEPE